MYFYVSELVHGSLYIFIDRPIFSYSNTERTAPADSRKQTNTGFTAQPFSEGCDYIPCPKKIHDPVSYNGRNKEGVEYNFKWYSKGL